MKGNKIKTLINLLDDKDIISSGIAMAEILKTHGAEKIIAKLQKINNSHLKEKADTMNQIILSRHVRKSLSKKLSEKDNDIFQGLIELHLQWFDEDKKDDIVDNWKKFKLEASEWDPTAIENLGKMMISLEMESVDFEELAPEDYCLGEIVSTRLGADFLICAITRILAEDNGWNPSIIYTDAGFCIYDEKRKLGLFPMKNWLCAQCSIPDNIQRWSNSMILNLAVHCMLLCAIATGNIRNSTLIGLCLSKKFGSVI
jgi:hypothetical protein